jgi:hypothetical protein
MEIKFFIFIIIFLDCELLRFEMFDVRFELRLDS